MRIKGTLLGLAMMLASAPAMAAPIIYTFYGRLSGTLAGTPFDYAATTLTLQSDTNLVFQPLASDPDLFNTPLTVLDFVIGGTGGSFVSQFNAFSNTINPRNALVGFTEAGSSDLIDVNDQSLAGYDLKSPVGPIFNFPLDFLNYGTLYQTSSGELVFANDDRAFIYFTARLAAAGVPEPESWALMIIGVGLVGGALRRQKPISFPAS